MTSPSIAASTLRASFWSGEDALTPEREAAQVLVRRHRGGGVRCRHVRRGVAWEGTVTTAEENSDRVGAEQDQVEIAIRTRFMFGSPFIGQKSKSRLRQPAFEPRTWYAADYSTESNSKYFANATMPPLACCQSKFSFGA